MSDDLYLALAAEQPTTVKLGGALITMPQAHAGREEPYNRWYEDDHMYSGAMVGPWVFSGRRFIRCELERFAATGAEPTDMGSFVSMYLVIDGHLDEVWRWAQAVLEPLTKEGRGPRDRTRVYTAMHELKFAHIFDPAPMAEIHALDYPYQGLAIELIDAPDINSRDELIQWLRDEYVPSEDGPIGQCLAFIPRGLREEKTSVEKDASVVALAIDPNPERRVCLMWLLRENPHDFWPGSFAKHAEKIETAGKGTLVFSAPFEPTIPGTETRLRTSFTQKKFNGKEHRKP